MYRHEQEPITIQRDVEAVIVPAGVPVTLHQGKTGFITQALGGSFTVYIEGNLFRVAGKDADALGKEVVAIPELPPNATDEQARAAFADLVEPLLSLSTCPDFIVNRGHYFGTSFMGEEHGLSDSDKRALIEFLKTF